MTNCKIEITNRNVAIQYLHAPNMGIALFDICMNLRKNLGWALDANPDLDVEEWIFNRISEIVYDENGLTSDILDPPG